MNLPVVYLKLINCVHWTT